MQSIHERPGGAAVLRSLCDRKKLEVFVTKKNSKRLSSNYVPVCGTALCFSPLDAEEEISTRANEAMSSQEKLFRLPKFIFPPPHTVESGHSQCGFSPDPSNLL